MLTALLMAATFAFMQGSAPASVQPPASKGPPAPEWKPAPGPLATRWSADVRPDKPWNIYPRPQLQRAEWTNLNGLWEFEIKAAAGARDGAAAPAPAAPTKGRILVPYPIESQLSGVGRALQPGERLVYRRTVDLKRPADGSIVMLNFGAVDWECTVAVNGTDVGKHQGGFDPFSVDITAALVDGANTVQVTVTDATDSSTQPRGKQVLKPGGIFYTQVSGIWQTVWLETLPPAHISSLRVEATLKDGMISFQPATAFGAQHSATLQFLVTDPSGVDVATARMSAMSHKGSCEVAVPNPLPWSPESPALYGITATLLSADGAVLDTVKSYCAFRTIAVSRDSRNRPVLALNGKPCFMIGLLDQGWWPDGLYTAPTYEAMLYDVQVTRQCGFNAIRKHVKVEPAVWYAACDRMGILVWQDMPSGDASIGPSDPDIKRTPASAATYERELRAMIEHLRHFPSIVLWVPFNEGWGQFDSKRITEMARNLDPSRLVTTASGWTDRGTGDTLDVHEYAPRLEGYTPPTRDGRAWVIGECGGFGLPEPGHMWKEEGWGYTTYKDREALTSAYELLAADLRELRADGLSAAIYTQTTDVETELNGVMTYDRDVIKFNSGRMLAANRALAAADPARTAVRVVVPSARDALRSGRPAPEWRISETEPSGDWTGTHSNTDDWRVARGGFGTKGTPGTADLIGTEWKSANIWLRRTFELAADAPKPTHFSVHHDEDAQIWLDGALVATLPGFVGSYVRVPIPADVRKLLTPGRHTLAVHCKQTTGGQFIDVGLCAVDEQR